MEPMQSLTPLGVSLHSGFPNPAADAIGRSTPLALDLNQLIRHPNSSYLFRVSGQSWAEQGIFSDDIVIIDRSLTPAPNDIVLYWENDAFVLATHSPLQQSIWGVVALTIHPRAIPNKGAIT